MAIGNLPFFLGMIEKAAIEGLGANQTLRTLKAVGLAVRRQTFLNVFREYAGIPAKEDILKFIPKKFAPSAANLTKSFKNLSARFMYVLDTTVKNVETGVIEHVNYSYLTDNVISVGEAEDKLMNQLIDRYTDWSIESVNYVKKVFYS